MSKAAIYRTRVISDNDYAGDPDGLVQLAHLLLSKSVDVRAVTSSHLLKVGPWPIPDQPAAAGADEAQIVVDLIGSNTKVLAGSDLPMPEAGVAADSAAVDFLIEEALRDSDVPLFVLCGGPLTVVASALIKRPEISSRFTLVWIGGEEYNFDPETNLIDEHVEFNLGADLHAARYVFNESNVEIWQVPRNVYRQTVTSWAEIELRLEPAGPLGNHLYGRLHKVAKFIESLGEAPLETFIFGDSPLTSLIALLSPLEMDPTSNNYRRVPAPKIGEDGHYVSNPAGREIRVFETIDTRLMLEDFFSKVSLFSKAQGA